MGTSIYYNYNLIMTKEERMITDVSGNLHRVRERETHKQED